MEKEEFYLNIKDTIYNLDNYWGNRKYKQPIPKGYCLNSKKVRNIIKEFVINLGIYNEKKHLYSYAVNGRPILIGNSGFSCPMSYPKIKIKKDKSFEEIRVKYIIYDVIKDELIFKFPSSHNSLNVNQIQFDVLKKQFYCVGKEYGKYEGFISLMKEICYNHNIPQGLYVKVYDVNGTKNEIRFIK